MRVFDTVRRLKIVANGRGVALPKEDVNRLPYSLQIPIKKSAWNLVKLLRVQASTEKKSVGTITSTWPGPTRKSKPGSDRQCSFTGWRSGS
jgi:hypothetical protein